MNSAHSFGTKELLICVKIAALVSNLSANQQGVKFRAADAFKALQSRIVGGKSTRDFLS
jgi:hypothetical protein